MGSRFRNELTVVPPVRIKVSRQGLSTTIGWNTGEAGHGMAAADGWAGSHVGKYVLSGPLPTDRFLIPGTRRDYGNGSVADMTSPGLSSFKALLEATRHREAEIKTDIRKARRQVVVAWVGRALGWASLASVVLPPVRRSASTALIAKRSDVEVLSNNLTATRISVDFDMETEVAAPHLRMRAALDGLSNAQRAWTVQTEQRINRVKARSFAGTVVARVGAVLTRRAHSLVATKDAPYAVGVQGCKSTAYFYPGFVLVAGGPQDEFALIDMREFEAVSEGIGFTETESVPRDSRQVGTTWAKANKNGSRDKRFAHNRELPIMAYGGLHLTGPGGFNEKLMFSRVEACAELAAAIAELKRVLSSGGATKRIEKTNAIGTRPERLP
jgi:hypothetical protein